MMGRAALDEALKRVIVATADKLAGLGFALRGGVLRVLRKGNSGVVEFQKSTRNSNDRLLFTVNLGVICGALLESEQPKLEKARSLDAHLRQRIGMLMPGRPDKWWEITNATDVNELANEVSDLISTEAAPYILRYLDTSELVALWRSGKSPGLTEGQRAKYQEKLNSQW